MANVIWLFLAAFSAVVGMGLLALSLEAHWRQVASSNPPRDSGKKVLRVIGVVSLVCALLFCLLADHATMATLVWVMLLATAAFTVGMLLAWLPMFMRPLSWLVSKAAHG